MNLKLIAAVFGLLIFSFAGYLIFGKMVDNPPKTNLGSLDTLGNKQTSETYFDFGDAPDGKQGQQFPSLLSSNGVRTQKTDEVWLGQTATTEKDSKQVNLDEADDGVKLAVNVCKQSTAYFFVRIKNPGQMVGTAYLNLYADWNKDGKWAGSDECANEWAVQNFIIDLGKQTEEIVVYKLQFTAGKNTGEIWYRGAVTVDQQMNETSTGEFLSGEVEDWGPKTGDEKYYNFYCMPDPLVISHGSRGNGKILPDLFSEPIFDAQFGQNFQPKNLKRQVTIKNNTFTFESSVKDIDPPKRSVPDFVDVRVSFGIGGKEAVLEKRCAVIVEHDELTIETPSRRTFPVPSKAPSVETKSGGSTKTESTEPTPTEVHSIQEGIPGVVKY